MTHPASPLVSVVVPVYRVEKYLHECMASLLAQSFRDFEVILVDDGSPDSCPELCEGYAAGNPPENGLPCVRVLHKRNEGLGMARNSGMDLASGKYIFFLDSDDILRDDALERLYEVAERSGAQAVHGRLARFVTPGRYSSDVHSAQERVITSADGLKKAALCSFADFPGDEPYTLEGSSCGALFDLKFLRDNNIRFRSEREFISEDYVFNYDVARKAKVLVQVPDTLYRYRLNPDSLTQSPKSDVMERIVDFCEKIEGMMLRDGYGAEAAKYTYGYAASRIRAQYKYLFRSKGKLTDKLRKAALWRSNPFFDRMVREFDWKAMSPLHRLNFSLFRTRSFRSLYLLIRLQQLLRHMKGHIGD